MEERNSFEKELQKDPFMEEAMEGYDHLSPAEAKKDYSELQKILARKTKGSRRLVLYRIAASVIVIAGITSILILTNEKRHSDQIAINTSRQQSIEITRNQPLTKPEKEIKSEPSESVIRNKEDGIQNSKKSKNEEYPAENKMIEENLNERDEILNADKADKEIIAESRSADELKPKSSVSAPAGALARSRSSMIKDSVINTDSSESEVQILGSRMEVSEKKGITSGGYMPPQPATGIKEFERYIRKNIHRPDSTTGRKIVDLIFLVRIDGIIDSFDIIRTPGFNYSDEAERLIKSGPVWKPAKKDGIEIEDKVKLRIVFR